MNSSDVDVITLDDSDEDDGVIGSSSSNSGLVYREEQMIRCNFCVDPGLLPVEVDRGEHRRKLHGNKLFYCDVCQPGEKGAKGFEEYGDIKKHVSRENGIRENDTANLHDFIRVPSKAEYLKTFRCKFCPGEGMKFVGLPEDTFHEHIYNMHGTKAPRRKPEKLIRECRICGGNWQTDAELERHISMEHLGCGKENIAPFAGFGPIEVESDEESSEDDDIKYVESRSKEVGVRRRMMEKAGDRDWHKETERFLNKVSTPQGNRRPHRRDVASSESSEDDDDIIRREIDKVQKTRKQLERSRTRLECPLCKEVVSSPINLEVHLANYHKEQCFTCKELECDLKAWIQLEQAVKHIKESKNHPREMNKEQLLSREFIKPPKNLESMSCVYCSPPLMIVGDTWEDMKMKLFIHMEVHEELHRGDDVRINANTLYSCRMCEETMSDEKTLDKHMLRHKRGRSRRSDSPGFKTPAGKRRRLDSSKGSEEVRSGDRNSQGRDKTVSRDGKRKSSGKREADSSFEEVLSSKNSTGRKDRSKSGEQREMFGCTLCGKEFSDRFYVYEHVNEHHGKPDSESVLAQYCSLPTDLRVVKCKYCIISWSGENPAMLKATLRSHREEHREMHTSVNDCFQLECKACSKIFQLPDLDPWMTHVNSHTSPTMHPMTAPIPLSRSALQCSYCLQPLDSKRELLRHVASQHINQSFECVSCQAVFPVMTEILDHMYVEHGLKGKTAEACIECPPDLRGVTCALCGWEVLGGGQRELELHLKAKHPKNEFNLRDVRFFCRLCSRDTLFSSEKRMDDHVRKHKEKGDGRGGYETTSKNMSVIKNINKHLTKGLEKDTAERDRAMQIDKSGSENNSRNIFLNSNRRTREENNDHDNSGDREKRDKKGDDAGANDGRDSAGRRRELGRYNHSIEGRREDEEIHDKERDRSDDKGRKRDKSDDRGRKRDRSDDRGREGQSTGYRDEGRQGWGQRKGGRNDARSSRQSNDNWYCSSCRFDNFARNRSCKKCNEPKPRDRDCSRVVGNVGYGRGRGGDRGRGGRGQTTPRGRGGRVDARGGRGRVGGVSKCRDSNAGNANRVPLGTREPEIDHLTELRKQIEEMTATAFNQQRIKEEGQIIVGKIIEEVLATVLDQTDENESCSPSEGIFDGDLRAESPTFQDETECPDVTPAPPSPDYSPPSHSPEYTPAPFSPDYTPTPHSPDYTPAPHSPNHTPAPHSPNHTPAPHSPDYNPAPHSPDYSPAPFSPGYTPAPQSPGLNYSRDRPTNLGYDSPMTNPSPTYQPASFESPRTTMDLESSKFKCSFCMKPFDMIFECYDHLQEEHGLGDDEDILKSHCLEPFGATYAPVPFTENDSIAPQSSNLNSEADPSEQHASTLPSINLVAYEGAGSESGDSGAIISGDEEEDNGTEAPEHNDNANDRYDLPPDMNDNTTHDNISRSSSSSPLLVQTIEELEIAFAREGDVKVVASEVLIKTEAYAAFMERFNKNNGVDKTLIEVGKEQNRSGEAEVGNISPEVIDKYFPVESVEKGKANEDNRT